MLSQEYGNLLQETRGWKRLQHSTFYLQQVRIMTERCTIPETFSALIVGTLNLSDKEDSDGSISSSVLVSQIEPFPALCRSSSNAWNASQDSFLLEAQETTIQMFPPQLLPLAGVINSSQIPGSVGVTKPPA